MPYLKVAYSKEFFKGTHDQKHSIFKGRKFKGAPTSNTEFSKAVILNAVQNKKQVKFEYKHFTT